MKNYKNILVAVDGSDEAKVALNKAFEVATKEGATLIIAHILDTRAFATVEQYDRTVATRAEEYGQELLQQYKTDAEEAGVPNVQTVLDFGSPKIKIPRDIAKKFNIDLIVTGATGLNAVERILIGSVSESIVRNSKCDVLIVRQ
jgi:nucleotide-binding universal stress UspA family protein